MSDLNLVVPKIEELVYRQLLLSDANTMSYNKNFELNISGYNMATGCLDFGKEKWVDWYECWIDNEPEKYYAYVVDNKRPIGEVALRYVSELEAHMVSIIIEDKYRGNGFGNLALGLLLDKAFCQLGVSVLLDEFPISRVNSLKLFSKFGFEVVEVKEENILIRLDKESYYSRLNSVEASPNY